MANLGSDNTPVVGQDFSLPAGAQIDEDGGDLVVRDSGGSIVLRRDEGAGTWDFVSGDLTGIASLEAEVASISNVVGEIGLDTPQTITSDTLTEVAYDFNKVEDSDVVTVDLSNNRITIDVAGTYLITATISYQSLSDSGSELRGDVVINGSPSDQSRTPTASGAIQSIPPALDILSSDGGEQITVQTRQTTGIDQSLQGDSRLNNLKVVRLG